MRGVVHEAAGGRYRVVCRDGSVVDATLRGRLKKRRDRTAQVVIGDEVEVEPAAGDAWVIHRVLPRRTELVRRARGGRAPRTLAANLDRAFAVVAARQPDARLEMIDRLLVLGEASGMHPILVVNKVDLPGAAEVARDLEEFYGSIGYDVLSVSAATGEGLERFREAVCSGSSALYGPSGVGKSTLLNAVDPRLELRTGALSRKTGTGRHTTVGSRLIPLECGGLVADTPGFADVGLWGVEASELERCFPEFAPYLGACRFRSCSHTHEPDCAVREAVEEGPIAPSRYQSYVTLRREAEESSATA